MILNAVIVKSAQKRINYILKTGNIYATGQSNSNISHEIRFYKNEEAAKKNYPKEIKGIIPITIDTANMEFLGENDIPITLSPHFTETDFEYIFTFDEEIKDLHYYCPTLINANTTKAPEQISTQELQMTEQIITQKMFELAQLIDYAPTDISFLKNAMHCQITHKDNDGSGRRNYTNDSYATLGDTILKFVLTEFLFDKGYDKAEITKRRESIEKNDTLFNLCNKSGVFKYAYNDEYFSPNAPKQNRVSHSKHDIYIEAIIAAIYKDKGLDYCKEWVIAFFNSYGIVFD